MLVDLGDVLVGELLQLLLGPVELVDGDLAVLLERLELVAGRPPQVADRDPALLGLVLDHLHQLLASLGRELREHQADHLAVVGRGDTQVGVLDGLLDGLHRALVVGGDDQHPGLGHVEPGQLLERHVGAVVVDLQLLDERRRGPTGADGREVGLGVAHGLGHLLGGLEQDVVDHRPTSGPHETSVPIGSPSRARRMLPGPIRSKTTIGSLLSMQNVMAVESITLRPRLRTSM